MSEKPSSAGAPSADELKGRLEQVDEQANLGAGEEEPDPATAENPPGEGGAGDKKRTQT